MDLFTHTLSAFLLATFLGLQSRHGSFALATLVAASLAPDLDALPIVLGQKYFYQYHRVLFHSLSGAFLLALGFSTAVYLLTPLKDYRLVLALSLAGVLLHLGVDLLASWKIPLLSPFNPQRFSLDVVWFIDLIMILVMGAALLWARADTKNAQFIIGVALVLIFGYVALRFYQQRAVANFVQRQVMPQDSAALSGVIPSRAGLFDWHAIVRQEDSYLVYDVHFYLAPGRFRMQKGEAGEPRVLSNLVLPLNSLPGRDIIAASREVELVRIFLERARYPLAQMKRWGSGYRVEWGDVHLMLSGGGIRGVIVDTDEQGYVTGQRFKLKPELELLNRDVILGEKP